MENRGIFVTQEQLQKIKEHLEDIISFNWSTKRNKEGMTVAEQFSSIITSAEDVEMILERSEEVVAYD